MPEIIPFALIHVGVSVALAAILVLAHERLHRADFLLYWALFWIAIAATLTISQIAVPLIAGLPAAHWLLRPLSAGSVFLVPFFPALMICAGLSVGGSLRGRSAWLYLAGICALGAALSVTHLVWGPIPNLARVRPVITGLAVFFFAFRLASKGGREVGRARLGLVFLACFYGIHNLFLGTRVYGPTGYSPWAATVGILFEFSLTLVLAWDTVDRAAEASMEAREFGRRFQSLLQSVGMAGLILDRAGMVEFCNAWLEEALRPDEVTGRLWPECFVPVKEREQVRAVYQTGLETGQWPAICEYSIVSGGRELNLQWYHTPLRDKSGKIVGTASLGVDLSQQRLLEKQVTQSQRLETLGRMAGGVAHDFNNHLTVINGYADMMMKDLDPEDPLYEGLRSIHTSGELAATLTAQLLTFSRRRKVAPAPISLNQTVTSAARILRRMIREDIEIEIDLAQDLGLTEADPGQLDHVVMNLVLNAGDAIAGPGQIRIATRAFCRLGNTEHTAGREFVVLAVEDTGSGMDQWTRQRIFEPFFTTKAEGKGTGLGLASVHGAVTQAGGWIEVSSEPGKGSAFSVFLPRVDAKNGAPQLTPVETAKAVGRPVVLLVEDQDEVRAFSAAALTAQCYEVLQASSGAEALRIAGAPPLDIALLVTDVVMPGMPGDELARLMRETRPELPVLFVSGHTFEHQIGEDSGAGVSGFLPKPYTADELCHHVTKMIPPLTRAAAVSANLAQ